MKTPSRRHIGWVFSNSPEAEGCVWFLQTHTCYELEMSNFKVTPEIPNGSQR